MYGLNHYLNVRFRQEKLKNVSISKICQKESNN